MQVIRKLNSLARNTMQSFPFINEGGCALFAAYSGLHLERAGIPVRVIVSDDVTNWEVSLDEVRKKLKNPKCKKSWNDAEVCFGHLALEFEYNGKEYWFEAAEGARRPGTRLMGMRIIPGHLTLEETLALAEEGKGWNSTFDRCSIPALKRLVEFHLSPLHKA